MCIRDRPWAGKYINSRTVKTNVDSLVGERAVLTEDADSMKQTGKALSLIHIYKLLFYFTADGRIDFRELVKDLAAVFRTRIELRQIGVRDETKMMGGLSLIHIYTKSIILQVSQRFSPHI